MKLNSLISAATLALTAFASLSMGEQRPSPWAEEIYELSIRHPLPELGVPGQRQLPVALPAELDMREYGDPNHPYADGEGVDHGALVWEEVNGPRHNRINIGFVSEGYTSREAFMKDFNRVVLDGLFGRVEPYITYRDRFNIYAFHGDSPDAGVPKWENIKTHFTAWGWYDILGPSNAPDSRVDPHQGVKNHIQYFTGTLDYIVVLVNKTARYAASGYGGSHFIKVAIGEAEEEGWTDDDVAALSHELGHSLGASDEEYVANPYGFDPLEEDHSMYQYQFPFISEIGDFMGPAYNNMWGHPKDDFSNVPWAHWIDHERIAEFGPLPWDQFVSQWNDESFLNYFEEHLRDSEWPITPGQSRHVRNLNGEYLFSRTYDEEAFLDLFPIGLYKKGGGQPLEMQVYSPTWVSAMDNQPVAWYGPVNREMMMLKTILNRVWPFENLTDPRKALRVGNNGILTVEADIVTKENVTVWWEIAGHKLLGEIVEVQREVQDGVFKSYYKAVLTLDPSTLGLSDVWETLTLKTYDETDFVRRDPANLRYAEHNWAVSIGTPDNKRPTIVNRHSYYGQDIPETVIHPFNDTDTDDYGVELGDKFFDFNRKGAFEWKIDDLSQLPYDSDAPIRPVLQEPGILSSVPGLFNVDKLTKFDQHKLDGGVQHHRDPNGWSAGYNLNETTYLQRQLKDLDFNALTDATYVALVLNDVITGWTQDSNYPYESWVRLFYPRETLEDLEDYGRSLDIDGDGMTFEQEFAVKSNPLDPDSNFKSSIEFASDGFVEITVENYQFDTDYRLMFSTDLKSWEDTKIDGVPRDRVFVPVLPDDPSSPGVFERAPITFQTDTFLSEGPVFFKVAATTRD